MSALLALRGRGKELQAAHGARPAVQRAHVLRPAPSSQLDGVHGGARGFPCRAVNGFSRIYRDVLLGDWCLSLSMVSKHETVTVTHVSIKLIIYERL